MDSKPRAMGKDPSLKARKDLFFDDTPVGAASDTPRKSFKEYLRETPPAPLPPLVKVGLWAASAVVAILLLAAMYRVSQPRKPKTTNGQSSTAVATEKFWG